MTTTISRVTRAGIFERKMRRAVLNFKLRIPLDLCDLSLVTVIRVLIQQQDLAIQRRQLTKMATTLCLFILSLASVSSLSPPPSRRQLIQYGTAALVAGGQMLVPPPAEAVIDELPAFLRPYTNLAPLGSPKSSQKTAGLTLQELKDRLEHDLVFGTQNKGGYFVTGDLSTDIFRDDCVFLDPTNEVASLSQYQKGVRLLFDPKTSVVQLLEPLVVDQEARTLSGRIRSRGFLQLPWRPYISAYESKLVYTIDNDGLVAQQAQVWSKPADQALKETFTPTIFTPPPASTLPKPSDEPAVVTQLFDKINGRRPSEYSQEERFEIAALIDEILAQKWDWNADELPGKWMLTYLQPGPEGGGIDRRIPFPDFDFNDSFQVFTADTVLNIGQVFGPLVQVEVSGSLQEKDAAQKSAPKRFMVDIDSGKLCFSKNCLPLPISGQGLFDGLYLGKRLRIGQNLNGGGARVVQVRMD